MLSARAEEMNERQAAEQGPFVAALTSLLDISLTFYHLSAFTGKDGDTQFVTAQQHLAAAQASVTLLDTRSSPQHATHVALVQYATALYALSANDVTAAQALLDAAYASLSGDAPGAGLNAWCQNTTVTRVCCARV